MLGGKGKGWNDEARNGDPMGVLMALCMAWRRLFFMGQFGGGN